MPIPSSGAISLSTIETEFGGSAPTSISEYYAGGANVPAGTSGTNGAVPSSGQISFSQFYGTSKIVTGSITYASPGSYTWTAPAGVTQVSVGVVGAGLGQYGGGNNPSGGTGLLSWNNIAVQPGTGYALTVGQNSGGCAGATPSSFFGTSYVSVGPNGYVGVNNGGDAPIYGVGYSAAAGGGGAGSSSYGAVGGKGGTACNNGQAGSSGNSQGYGAGGGGGRNGFQFGPCKLVPDYYSCPNGGVKAYVANSLTYQGAGGGGGIGLLGAKGPAGAGGGPAAGGGAAPDGFNGGGTGGTAAGPGGSYGGGSGGAGVAYSCAQMIEVYGNVLYASGQNGSGANGGLGAVRIVWPGNTRQFPKTCVGNP